MAEDTIPNTGDPGPADTVKMRVVGERADVKAMIEVLDPVLDIVQDWRIFPQRNGIKVSAYLEARPRIESRGEA